jgi:hypothetical protein
LRKLKDELGALRKQAEESNRRLTQSEKRKKFWMAAAVISFAALFLVEGGRLLIK